MIAQKLLPGYGYTDDQTKKIVNLILSTKFSIEPQTPLEKIMCDADHDYLGRPDYMSIANKLRQELEIFDRTFSDEEWIRFQLNFLENQHHYYTETAKNIREQGKFNRIAELRRELELLKNKSI